MKIIRHWEILHWTQDILSVPFMKSFTVIMSTCGTDFNTINYEDIFGIIVIYYDKFKMILTIIFWRTSSVFSLTIITSISIWRFIYHQTKRHSSTFHIVFLTFFIYQMLMIINWSTLGILFKVHKILNITPTCNRSTLSLRCVVWKLSSSKI